MGLGVPGHLFLSRLPAGEASHPRCTHSALAGVLVCVSHVQPVSAPVHRAHVRRSPLAIEVRICSLAVCLWWGIVMRSCVGLMKDGYTCNGVFTPARDLSINAVQNACKTLGFVCGATLLACTVHAVLARFGTLMMSIQSGTRVPRRERVLVPDAGEGVGRTGIGGARGPEISTETVIGWRRRKPRARPGRGRGGPSRLCDRLAAGFPAATQCCCCSCNSVLLVIPGGFADIFAARPPCHL